MFSGNMRRTVMLNRIVFRPSDEVQLKRFFMYLLVIVHMILYVKLRYIYPHVSNFFITSL